MASKPEGFLLTQISFSFPKPLGAGLERLIVYSLIEHALSLLKPFPADLMDGYEVSKLVNSPSNDRPESSHLSLGLLPLPSLRIRRTHPLTPDIGGS